MIHPHLLLLLWILDQNVAEELDIKLIMDSQCIKLLHLISNFLFMDEQVLCYFLE